MNHTIVTKESRFMAVELSRGEGSTYATLASALMAATAGRSVDNVKVLSPSQAIVTLGSTDRGREFGFVGVDAFGGADDVVREVSRAIEPLESQGRTCVMVDWLPGGAILWTGHVEGTEELPEYRRPVYANRTEAFLAAMGYLDLVDGLAEEDCTAAELGMLGQRLGQMAVFVLEQSGRAARARRLVHFIEPVAKVVAGLLMLRHNG
jgi:hypothetical protein